MIRKDYYGVLGVTRGESSRGIQDAFRELAKKYDPHWAGPEGTRKFQGIQQAYGILSDPEKRKLYNRQLERDEISAASHAEPIFPGPSSRPEPPLVPEPMSLLRDFETIRPSFEPLFERLSRTSREKEFRKANDSKLSMLK